MDYINEALLLGVDAIILGFCLKEYSRQKSVITVLKTAPQLAIDENLISTVAKLPGQKVPYALIRGTVVPIGSPMKAAMSPSVTAVLQVMKLHEHRITKGFAGFWTEQSKLLHVSANDVPFCLKNGNVAVEILDGLSSEILDLDVVYDNYEPAKLSFFDHIFGFVSGITQRGLQTTEEVLREGSYITAVGELELASEGGLKLQPSNIGPMFLTTATKTTLIRRFEEARSSTFVKIMFCGTISAILIGIIGRKYWLKRKQEREERLFKESLEKSRKERRSKQRPECLPDDQKCVVCVTNPKEVIVLPCGHVCLCEDCAIKIKLACPVCRSKIENKMAAYYS